MRNAKWLALMVALLTCGLIAAGCGDDEDSSSTVATPTEETTTEDSTTEDATAEETTTEESDDSESTDSSPDDVYNACIDVIEGTAAEAAGQSACEQARDAFEQCAQQADAIGDDSARDLAVQACQNAADQSVAALEAAG